jgi:hypothetical protein
MGGIDMLKKVTNLALAMVFAMGLVFATTADVQAQQVPAAVQDTVEGFDAYRAMAITGGVIGGAIVAAVVTDGLIIPVYAVATGAGMPSLGMGVITGPGYAFFRGSMRLLGAVSGAMFADSWYTGQ